MNRSLLKLAEHEFREIVDIYLSPLLDIRGDIKIKERASKNTELVSYSQNEKGQGTLRIYP